MRDFLEKIVFVDFEASSLSPESWPIEVGLASLVNPRGPEPSIRQWSSLIRPAPGWSLQDWSPESAAVHCIALETLDTAPSAVAVAGEIIDRIGGKLLISDNPACEKKWLDRLMVYSPEIRPREFTHFDTLVISVCKGLPLIAMDMIYEELERIKAPHRAGPDAARTARAILKGVRVGTGLEPSPFEKRSRNPGPAP